MSGRSNGWLDGGGVPRAPYFIERKVLKGRHAKNKGKIQEKVSVMKNEGGT